MMMRSARPLLFSVSHERPHEGYVAGLLRRNVEAERRAWAEGGVQTIRRADNLVSMKLVIGVDQAEFDREPDEFARRVDLAIAVAPPHQRLESDDLLASDVDLRLKCAAELLVAKRKTEPLLDLHPRSEGRAMPRSK